MAQTKITVDYITALTSSAAELNYVDITTLGTAQASKVLTADANVDVGLGLRNLTGTGFLQGSTILVKGTTNSITIDADNPSAYTVVLPNAAPAAGKVLKTTSSSTTQLEWGDAGGVALATSTGNQIVTVTGTNAITGEAGLTFDASAPTLKIRGESGAPATSSTTELAVLRLNPTGVTGTLDMGFHADSTGRAWIQATDTGNLATNYNLHLNPNGGNVGIGIGTGAAVNKLMIIEDKRNNTNPTFHISNPAWNDTNVHNYGLYMYQNNAGTGVIGNNNKDVITIPSNGITTFTAGGDESIRLANASGITWSLQSRSDSEFRITDNANGTTRVRVQATTSGEMYLKENSSYINVNKGLAKAWLNFYHAVTIQENYNCAIVHHDTGKYRIDIGNDMETANYAVVHGSSYDRLVTQDNGNHNTVSSAYIYTAQFNGTLINVPNDQVQTCGVAIFGTAT